eukprot:2110589-Prymnesium_polylepis.1
MQRKRKKSRNCRAPTGTHIKHTSAIGGHSTNETPPRDHPGGSDALTDPHEPAHHPVIGHRCGRRACGGLCRL